MPCGGTPYLLQQVVVRPTWYCLNSPTDCVAIPACCFVQAPPGAPSDVWVQLLQCCAKYQVLQPDVIESMLRHTQQQQQQVARQADRLEQQEQRVQMLEGQLQELLTELRQHRK